MKMLRKKNKYGSTEDMGEVEQLKVNEWRGYMGIYWICRCRTILGNDWA